MAVTLGSIPGTRTGLMRAWSRMLWPASSACQVCSVERPSGLTKPRPVIVGTRTGTRESYGTAGVEATELLRAIRGLQSHEESGSLRVRSEPGVGGGEDVPKRQTVAGSA